jgi:hypothetical protein
MRRVVWILTIILAGSASIGIADELPDELLARGRPETVLAGIDLKHTTIEKIVKRFGKPTAEKRWEPAMPNSVGQIDYYWHKKGLDLHVGIQYSNKEPDWKPVDRVEIGPGTSRQLGKTGAGLKLGDSLSDLRRLYGRRFHMRDIPKSKIHDVMIQWRREEYSLVATLDQRNRITSLTLVTPE